MFSSDDTVGVHVGLVILGWKLLIKWEMTVIIGNHDYYGIVTNGGANINKLGFSTAI